MDSQNCGRNKFYKLFLNILTSVKLLSLSRIYLFFVISNEWIVFDDITLNFGTFSHI